MVGILLRSALAATLVCLLALPAHAQNPGDDPDEHGTGLILDTPEQLAAVPQTSVYRNFLPERVDLSSRLPQPGNQGRQGSCVGWAVGYAARSYYVGRDGRSLNNNHNIPSPAFIYNAIKPAGGCDTGSNIFMALLLLRNKGALSLDDFPYSQSRCSPVSDAMRDSATDFRLRDFEIVDVKKPDQVKAELAKENPVILSLRITKAFHRLRYGEVYRDPDEQSGNHAITAVGYDDRRQAFKLINSWGTSWGDNGYAWIDYDTFTREVKFAYVLRVDPKPKPEPVPVVVVPPTPPVVPPVPAPVVVVRPPAPAPVVDVDTSKCEQVRRITVAGKLTLTGFVGSDERLEQWKTDPANANSDIKIAVRPWPQCEALLTLDKNISRDDKPAVKIRRASGDTLSEGDNLVLEVETPSFPSYLHVAYVQADGSVLNLVQPGADNLKVYPPHSKVVFGDGEGGGTKFKVSPPYGREMLVVTAAKAPLFSDARPPQETEREFLTALRLALVAKPDPSLPDRDVAANFDAIVTTEKRAQ